jgi:hypothetical protein
MLSLIPLSQVHQDIGCKTAMLYIRSSPKKDKTTRRESTPRTKLSCHLPPLN